MGMGVNVASFTAKKSHQGDAHILCEVDGQAGGSAYRSDKSDAGHGRFLNQFEGNPSAEHEYLVVEGDRWRIQNTLTNQLVERVVSANVLRRADEIPIQIKQCATVYATRLGKIGLLVSQ